VYIGKLGPSICARVDEEMPKMVLAERAVTLQFWLAAQNIARIV
jgi:hypothetical protein